MDRPEQELSKAFEAQFSAGERSAILHDLLSKALTEIPCPACNSALFTVNPAQSVASLECPACRQRTLIHYDGSKLLVVSEERLTRIIRHAKAKTWYCQDHDGVAVELASVEQDPGNPLQVTLHFVCRRPSGPFRKRAHAITRAINLLSLEGEMLAEGG